MKNKILITSIMIVFLISLIPLEFTQAQTFPAEAGQELTPSDIEVGLIDNNELWLKSGSRLYYTQDGGNQWGDITPDSALDEPYLLVSFPASDLGYALYFTQTEFSLELEIIKTTTKGTAWSLVSGDLEEKINQQFYQPFGEIQMQWLDERNAMVLVKESSSSNFSIGTLFISEDGGKSWSAKEVPVAEKLVFLDPLVGYMLNPAGSESLYRTQDGGNSWNLVEINLPEVLESGAFQLSLPISMSDGRVYLPIKTLKEDAKSIDYLVGIEPSSTAKSMIELESFGILPILPPSNQKQIPQTSSEHISKIQTQDAQDIWITLKDGVCENHLADDGELDIICESSWQMVRSQSGGLEWVTVSLPGGLNSVTETSTTTTEFNKNDLGEKQILSGAEVGDFSGHAFDKCEIPTLSQLQSWYTSSPYKAVNLYIGGIARFCSNLPLTATYLHSMFLQGWRFIPTWVGPQAPCSGRPYKFPYDPELAYQSGVDNANQARAKMIELGLTNPDGSGGIIYLDLEHFSYSSTCSAAARAYVSGWTTRLSQLGIMSGLYSTSTGIRDNEYFNLEIPPYAVWIAEWYTNPGFRSYETVWDLRYLSDQYWTNNQRILQYSGGHSETWGGVSLDIDCNVAEGKVAVPFGADLVPPITTAGINGTFGYEDWYKTPVQVTLTATDNTVGVKHTFYKIDQGTWNLYGGPFYVSGGDLTSLRFLSVDNADNWEGPKLISFKVDTVAPVLSHLTRVGCLALNGVPQRWCNNAYFVWDDAIDTGVGVPSSLAYQYYWGTNPQGTSSSYTHGIWFDPAAIPMKTPYYLRLRAQDNHGNWSAWKTMFTLIYDPFAKDPIWMPITGKN